jgi:hypothetical protein
VYIKGARDEISVNTIKAPKSKSIITIGASQNFFLTLRKFQNSITMESLLIFPS